MPLSPEERELGLGAGITRRDFLGTVALGTGAALLGMPPPSDSWTGFGGVGDYARCNGNTWPVVSAAHGLRDGTYAAAIPGATDTGETYDLAIVGGGFAGAVAAYYFLKETGRRRSCLLMDNHPLLGGVAKRNELRVRGETLIGPQGSNEGSPPTAHTERWRAELWRELGLPEHYEMGRLAPGRRPLTFADTNYEYQLWSDNFESHGFFFENPERRWVRNPWGHRLEGTPWAPEVKRDLLRWREEPTAPWKGDAESLRAHLDAMTYEHWLTQVRGFHPEVARYVDPIYAAAVGLGSDVLSAWSAYTLALPGFQGLGVDPRTEERARNNRLTDPQREQSFPGGNDGIFRCLVKALNPEAIDGSGAFAAVHNGHYRPERFDRPGTPCRMRTEALAIRILPGKGAGPATVIYAKHGKVFTLRARTVIWAGAAFTAKHAIQGLPEDFAAAMESFPRSPMLSVNVALDNWRFLDRLGYTACSWRGGFGFTANIRPNMYVGDYRPPLDPDRPNLFTFYVPFNQHGLSLVDQGNAGRGRLFGTSYRDFELQIRRQMATLFADAGFDPARDIAGIVINRWGHAFCNAGPGFYSPRNGRPPASDVLRQGFGRILFAHSELNGNQHWSAAAAEGRRAAYQAVAQLS